MSKNAFIKSSMFYVGYRLAFLLNWNTSFYPAETIQPFQKKHKMDMHMKTNVEWTQIYNIHAHFGIYIYKENVILKDTETTCDVNIFNLNFSSNRYATLDFFSNRCINNCHIRSCVREMASYVFFWIEDMHLHCNSVS